MFTIRNEDSGLGSDTQDPAAVPVEWIGEAGSTITSDDGEPQRRSLQRQLQPRTREDFAYLHEQVRLWMERVRIYLTSCPSDAAEIPSSAYDR